jgi:predicted amidohydrolase YtcJ
MGSAAVVACWMFASVGCAVSGGRHGTVPAETIYVGGQILTMAGERPAYVEALAVREGKIVHAGSRSAAMKQVGSGTRVVDLGGRVLLPGFIDGHGHIADYIQQWTLPVLNPPPVGDVNSIEDIRRKLAEHLREKPPVPGRLVVAVGYDDSLLKERRHPTRVDLDAVSADVPIVILHTSGHLLVANSAALKLARLTKDTEEIPGGVIQRDPATGEPNGIIEEQAAYAFLPFFPRQTREEQVRVFAEVQKLWVSHGITTAQDGIANPDNVNFLREEARQGRLMLDVVSYPMWKVLTKVMRGEVAMEGVEVYPPGSQVSNAGRARPGRAGMEAVPVPGEGSTRRIRVGVYENHLKIGGVKITGDGSPQGKTAFMTLPYTRPPAGLPSDYRAYPSIEQAELDAWVEWGYRNDLQMLVHSNGDAAVEAFLKSVERARRIVGAKDLRPVAIHAQFARHEQVDRMKALGIVPSFFTAHTFFWGDTHIETFGAERAFGISPLAHAHGIGLKFSNHNDSPVVPPDILMLTWTAVNRLSRSGVVVGPKERVSPYVALKAVTDWAAYQYHEEAEKGTLEVGKLADLVVLDRNPLTVDPARIREIRVLETIKEGKTIYTRPSGH